MVLQVSNDWALRSWLLGFGAGVASWNQRRRRSPTRSSRSSSADVRYEPGLDLEPLAPTPVRRCRSRPLLGPAEPFNQDADRLVQLRILADERFAERPQDFDVNFTRHAFHLAAVRCLHTLPWQTQRRSVDETFVPRVDNPARRRLADDRSQLQRAIAFREIFGVRQRCWLVTSTVADSSARWPSTPRAGASGTARVDMRRYGCRVNTSSA